MTKYRQEVEGENGWSRWIDPIHGIGKRNYRLACCDCGLIHEVQFRIRKSKNGVFSVIFRAKRNNRATAAKRRKKRA